MSKVADPSLNIRSVHTWSELKWEPMQLDGCPLPGFSWQPLTGDEANAWAAYWMRLETEARSPVHEHPSTELLLIHEGTLHDDNGMIYGPGDVVVFAAGSTHSTFSPSGCCALVVACTQARLLES